MWYEHCIYEWIRMLDMKPTRHIRSYGFPEVFHNSSSWIIHFSGPLRSILEISVRCMEKTSVWCLDPKDSAHFLRIHDFSTIFEVLGRFQGCRRFLFRCLKCLQVKKQLGGSQPWALWLYSMVNYTDFMFEIREGRNSRIWGHQSKWWNMCSFQLLL